jgi:hypothetical protein
MTVPLKMQSYRLVYYINFLIFPFQTQIDAGDNRVEGRDFSDSQTSSSQSATGHKMKEDVVVTTAPVSRAAYDV